MQTNTQLEQQLKKLGLQGEVTADSATLEKFSHDASFFEIKPEVVIHPKNADDIKKVVRFVAENKKNNPTLSLTPRSAGTDMSGGPLSESVVLEFTTHFNHIDEIIADPSGGGGTATVEPGVFYRDFEKETLKKDLLLPPYPASRELCALGGMVANNSAGEKTLTYGKMEDYVLELRVVLADGNEYLIKPLNQAELQAKMAQQDFEGDLYRRVFKLLSENYAHIELAKPHVSKNSAGYFLWNVWDKEKGVFDLTKLIVGSQGTLGIVTKIKVRLIQPTKHSQMLVLFMNDLNNLAQIVNTILSFKPESFESYDDKTLKLAVKFMPEMFKYMKTKNIFKLGFQFIPEMWMALTGGFPKLVLMAEFTGNDQKNIAEQAKNCFDAVQKFGVKSRVISEQESQKYWTIRRESFNLLRHHISGKRTAPFIDDIIVEPQYLPEFLPKLNNILSQYNLVYTIAGHVGNGNFHIIPLMDFHDPNAHKIVEELSQKVYDLVLSYHGSITAEHNDGLIRSPFLKQMYGPEIYRLFEEVKKIFDPQDIFNPGKKVGSTMKYAMEHLVRQ